VACCVPRPQKWSKGKVKEKVNNLVLFDQVRRGGGARAAAVAGRRAAPAAATPSFVPCDRLRHAAVVAAA
jgi:hypothetical protein